MEKTNENKAKLFAQYWGQEVVRTRLGVPSKVCGIYFNTDYVELRPLFTATDEEAIEVALRCGYLTDKHTEDEMINIGRSCLILFLQDYHLSIEAIDYLRSKGFALPYMGLSVETMVEYGWVKLIQAK